MAQYQGNWDDLEDAVNAPNVVNVHDTSDGVTVIFKVHGKEGFRAYHYTAPSAQALEEAFALLFGGAAVGAAAMISGMTGGIANGSNPNSGSTNGTNPRSMNSSPFD